MKISLLCFFALLPVPALAAPVHIALKASASAAPNADGFLTLGTVAGITGGDKAARARFAAVPVARAPLSGETRRLTRGDLALKLRQAGINPDTQAILEGAEAADVTADDSPKSPPAPILGSHTEQSGRPFDNASFPTPAPQNWPSQEQSGLKGEGASSPLIHSGDAVTITIQSGAMTITAPATARENGRAGDTIRVQRPGITADLSVQVVDAQTVHMEI